MSELKRKLMMLVCCLVAVSAASICVVGQPAPIIDGAVKLWDVATGKPKDVIFRGQSDVTSIAYSPDGKILATGSSDRNVRLWAAETGTLLKTLTGHTQAVRSVAFSPNGKTLASGSSDSTIKLWEVATGRALSSLLGHSDSVNSVKFSPSGKILASVSSDKTIKLWEVATGRVRPFVRPFGIRFVDTVNSVAFSTDGKVLAAGHRNGRIELLEVSPPPDAKPRSLSRHLSQVNSVSFSPDGRLLASGSADETIKLWNVSTGAEVRIYKGHASSVNSIAFSPDGKLLLSGSYDKTMVLWDVATGKQLHRLTDVSNEITSVAFSPDGKTVAGGIFAKQSERPSLYIFAIGIDKYASQYREKGVPNIVRAANDAQAAASAFEAAGNNTFERVTKRVLLDQEATRESILNALYEFVGQVKPYDTFIFYYSGIALSSENLTGGLENASKGELFLLPYDYNVLLIEDRGNIPASYLQVLLAKIQARHQLVILDADKSSKGFDTFVKYIEKENKKFEGLLQRDVVIFSIAELSYASLIKSIDGLIHGVLTNILLQGLRGDADLNGDGITARELTRFVEQNNTKLDNDDESMKTKIHIYTTGEDFFLGRAASVRPAGRGAIQYNRGRFSYSSFAHVDSSLFVSQDQPPIRAELGKVGEGVQKKVSETIGKSYALLVATDVYETWPPLNNPIHDVEVIADELKNYYGFDIGEGDILKNPKKRDIIKALRLKRDKVYSDNDQLFIFFAGHGHYLDEFKEGFIIAADSSKNDDLGDSYIQHSLLRKVVDSIPCKHILLVIDACFGGTFDDVVARRGGDLYDDATNIEFVQRKMQFKTRRYITSGGKEYVSDGRPGQHSPFSRRLIEALRGYGGKYGLLTINSILSYVERATPEPKTGEFGTNEPGSDFIFLAKKPQQ